MKVSLTDHANNTIKRIPWTDTERFILKRERALGYTWPTIARYMSVLFGTFRGASACESQWRMLKRKDEKERRRLARTLSFESVVNNSKGDVE